MHALACSVSLAKFPGLDDHSPFCLPSFMSLNRMFSLVPCRSTLPAFPRRNIKKLGVWAGRRGYWALASGRGWCSWWNDKMGNGRQVCVCTHVYYLYGVHGTRYMRCLCSLSVGPEQNGSSTKVSWFYYEGFVRGQGRCYSYNLLELNIKRTVGPRAWVHSQLSEKVRLNIVHFFR